MDRKDKLPVINEVRITGAVYVHLYTVTLSCALLWQICEMKNCTQCIFFEMRKKKDLYMWCVQSILCLPFMCILLCMLLLYAGYLVYRMDPRPSSWWRMVNDYYRSSHSNGEGECSGTLWFLPMLKRRWVHINSVCHKKESVPLHQLLPMLILVWGGKTVPLLSFFPM